MSAENTENKNKYQVWKIVLLPIILALIPFIYPEVKDLLARKQPQFILEDPVLKKGDDVIYIFAENSAAQKKANLNIEIGGLEIKDAGKLIKNSPLEWEFNFLEYDLPRAILGEGLNMITVSFAGGQNSADLNFYINADFFQEAMAVAPVRKGGDEILTPSVESDIVITNPVENKPVSTTSVKVFSTTSDDDPLVKETMNALADQGLENVVGYQDKVGHVEANFKGGELRYFTEEGKAKAEKVKKILEEKGKDYKLVDYNEKLGTRRKNTKIVKDPGVELWLGRNKK